MNELYFEIRDTPKYYTERTNKKHTKSNVELKVYWTLPKKVK
jgi:hypothetical protein